MNKGRFVAVRRLSAISWRFAALGVAAIVLASCQGSEIPKHLKPVPPALLSTMDRLGMKETSPIFIRIFKEESQLEVWKEQRDGQFALLRTYEICQWSGELGPKRVEGDRQAPEGFYTVTPAQMNPNSDYYLSFNIGYPNAFDRSLGRTGSNLMVHGACSSAGCYSMTDDSAGELFALARDSFRGGQRSFQIQAFPFRMTPENLAKHHDNPNLDFWRMLKVGYDSFELTRVPPQVDVCDRRYVFNAESNATPFEASAVCPAYTVPESLALALAAKEAADQEKYAAVVAALEKQAAGPQVAAATSAPQAGAPRQSLLDRWLGMFNRDDDRAPATAGSIPSAGPSSPAVAAVPLPTVRPPASPPPSPVPAPAPTATATATPAPASAAPAATAPAATVSGTPATILGAAPIMAPDLGQPDPAVGTFVERPFWWYDDAPATPTN